MKDTMKCDGCRKEVESISAATCLTSHVDLTDYNLDDRISCPEDYFYCPDCLNKLEFCKDCASKISPPLQQKIHQDFNKK